MNLVRLLARLGPGALYRVFGYAVVSALATTVLLALVNEAASEISASGQAKVNFRLLAGFVLSLTVYTAAESRMVASMGAAIEKAVHQVRAALLRRLARADVWKLEHFGRARLYETITRSTQTVSANSQFVAMALRSALLTLAILVYIAAISPLAFLLVTALLGLNAVAYQRRDKALSDRKLAHAAERARLHEGIEDLLEGFKEQRINSARSRDLRRGFTAASDTTRHSQSIVLRHGWRQVTFGTTNFNIIMGVVVFVVPAYSNSFSEHVVKVAAAVLFMAGPFAALLHTATLMRRSETAIAEMFSLETDLAQLEEAGAGSPPVPVPLDFREITLTGVKFAYPAPAGERPFAVGPIDFTLRRGETVFVTGGNGSGKSSYIRLLTGLYHPVSGRIAIDGVPVESSRYESYRGLMATVFSDFHLFARLYDIAKESAEDGPALMRRMEMDQITTLTNDRFGRIDLSTGQKKRLGLIAALLERKPILILDEWAADQDPQFRRIFYREILPELKARGLTIVAVTHDDAYFDQADRRIRMEEGRIIDHGTRQELPCD